MPWPRSSALLVAGAVGLFGCSSAPVSSSGSTSAGGGHGAGGSDGAPACAPSITFDVVHLAAGVTIPSGADETYCLRWTAPDDLDVTGFTGVLGPGGHHALLLTRASSSDPDGLAPCSEASIMDAEVLGPFGLLAGVSFGDSGERVDFPTTPSQTGLHLAKGTQLVLDAHLLNPTSESVDACASIDLVRGAVEVPLELRTVLPAAEYALSVPAHGSISVSYPAPSGGGYRVVGAWAHMHEGATEVQLSIEETGTAVYETDDWAEPKPTMFGDHAVLVESAQSFLLGCSFANDGSAAVGFPAQMCVGVMYLLSCGVAGAC